MTWRFSAAAVSAARVAIWHAGGVRSRGGTAQRGAASAFSPLFALLDSLLACGHA